MNDDTFLMYKEKAEHLGEFQIFREGDGNIRKFYK